MIGSKARCRGDRTGSAQLIAEEQALIAEEQALGDAEPEDEQEKER